MEFIGKIINGRYKIYDKVGSGGMATVYLARDLKTNEVVAVKILHSEYANNEQYTRRFLKEAETALRMKQENITEVKDFGMFLDTYYIVMEYVQRKTLERIIQEKGKLSEEETIKFALGVASALEYARKHGLIAHRDIKPQNIMITTDGTVKVMDFGIAKTTGKEGLTINGTILGTPFYISPEQAKGQPPDIRSDLYSLGVTMYQALTGKVPFDGDTPWTVINMQINEEVPKIERKDISDNLKKIVYKLLRKNPDERYSTPFDLISDLKKIEKENSSKTVILTNLQTAKNQKSKSVPLPERERVPNAFKAKKAEHDKTEMLQQESAEKYADKQKPFAIKLPKVFFKWKTILIAAIVVLILLGAVWAVKITSHSRTALNNEWKTSINNGTAFNREEGTSGKNAFGTSGSSGQVSKKYGSIRIVTDPEGAEIVINGKDTGFKTPNTIRNLAPGNYEITCKKSGYEPAVRNATVKEGQILEITLHLKKKEMVGYLSIVSDPGGAEIIIDGTDKGIKTPNMLKLKPGEYTLVLRKTGFEEFTKKIKIKDGETTKVSAILTKIPRGKLVINSNPEGAEVVIDGRDTGRKTPFEGFFYAGKHSIELILKGYERYTLKTEIKEGKETRLFVPLKKSEDIPQYKTFENELYKFSYPSKWDLTENPDENTDIEIDSPPFEDDYLATCFIYRDDLEEENITFEDLLEAAKTDYLKNPKTVTEGYATINGKRYYKLVLQGIGEDEDGNPMALKTALFFLKKGATVYTIEFDATPKDFAKAWNGFYLILKSFEAQP